MGDIDRSLIRAPRSPIGEQRALGLNRLGLNEKLVEGRVLSIRPVGGQRQLEVAGQLELDWFGGSIGYRDPANLDIFFRRDDDLGVGLNPLVPVPEFDSVEVKSDRIILRFFRHRLEGIGPEPVAVDVPNVAERSPVIPSRVCSPAGDIQVTPAAVSTTRTGDHQAVAPVPQQLHFGDLGVNRVISTDRRSDSRRLGPGQQPLAGRNVVNGRNGRNSFIQQGFGGPHPRVGMEPALNQTPIDKVIQGQQAHALVMSHVGSHDHTPFFLFARLSAEIDGLIEAVVIQ